ncbi:MAG: mechanosensitive ion channel [Caldilineaceae bacterium]|nr:mechanosensitive ion channel [Caldilineaceae bacterium]
MGTQAFWQFNIDGSFLDLARTSVVVRLLIILLMFGAVWVTSRYLPRILARGVLSTVRAGRSHPLSPQRQKTINSLVRDLTVFLLYLVAAVVSLALFVDSRGLLTFLGLFSAGFGLGARPVVSDYISGIVFLFEDQYSIGDTVEIDSVEGTVEHLSLRTTTIRSRSGEVYFVPNGEIRIIRNFSRGVFSLASVHVRVKSNHIQPTMAVLNELVTEYRRIDNLIEAPRIISEDGVIGSDMSLTLLAKATYGKGVEVRRALIEYINTHLTEAGVEVR